MKRSKKLKIAYQFDQAIIDRQERLASAYEMVFNKIIEMEAKKYEGKKKVNERYI